MTDAAEEMLRAWPGIGGGAQASLDALLSLAPDTFPRRVVLEQESEGAPVVVRLLERGAGMDGLGHHGDALFRLSDVLEEDQ